jgi:hypothetical protein
MTRRSSPFRQVDIVRAIKAAKATGATDVRVELEPSGKLVLSPVPLLGDPQTTASTA